MHEAEKICDQLINSKLHDKIRCSFVGMLGIIS